LRDRVDKDFSPMLWDVLTPDQRRSIAHQWDYHHDPAAEGDRKFWWDFFVKKEEIEQQIEDWRAVDAPTAGDLARKESRLAELEKELARMKRCERRAQRDYLPEQEHLDRPAAAAVCADSQVNYIAYPSAVKMLASLPT
jgi:hypothetical protein